MRNESKGAPVRSHDLIPKTLIINRLQRLISAFSFLYLIDFEQVKTESKIQYRQADIEFEIKKLEVEARTKRELMQFEYELNVKLKELELQAQKELVEKQSETQKDVAAMKTSTASLSGPPDSGKPAKSFESKGNDVLGGIDLSRFEPR